MKGRIALLAALWHTLRSFGPLALVALFVVGSANAGTILPTPTITLKASGSDVPGGETQVQVDVVSTGTDLVWGLASDFEWTVPGAFSVVLCSGPGGHALCTGPEGAATSFDQDPVLSYFGAVQDFGAPSSFSFIFAQAIVDTPAPGTASHSQASSTTDGGSDGVSIAALAPPAGIPVDGNNGTEINVFSLSLDGGSNFLNPGLDLRSSFATGSGSESQPGLAESGPGPAGAGNYDFMRVDVNFGMGGDDDIYTFSGRTEIVEAPAPTALWLLGLGLAGLRVRRDARITLLQI